VRRVPCRQADVFLVEKVQASKAALLLPWAGSRRADVRWRPVFELFFQIADQRALDTVWLTRTPARDACTFSIMRLRKPASPPWRHHLVGLATEVQLGHETLSLPRLLIYRSSGGIASPLVGVKRAGLHSLNQNCSSAPTIALKMASGSGLLAAG